MSTHSPIFLRLAATTLACAAAIISNVAQASAYFAVLPLAKASIPQHAYQASVSVSVDSIIANGSSTTTIIVAVTDQEGNPAGGGVPVAWSTDLGVLISQEGTTDAAGTARAVLRAGSVEGTATVWAVVEGSPVSIGVIFTATLPPADCRYVSGYIGLAYMARDLYLPNPDGGITSGIYSWGTSVFASALSGYTWTNPVPPGSSAGLPEGYRRGRLVESHTEGSWFEHHYEICKIS